jgi:hypothetical protein
LRFCRFGGSWLSSGLSQANCIGARRVWKRLF